MDSINLSTKYTIQSLLRIDKCYIHKGTSSRLSHIQCYSQLMLSGWLPPTSAPLLAVVWFSDFQAMGSAT